MRAWSPSSPSFPRPDRFWTLVSPTCPNIFFVCPGISLIWSVTASIKVRLVFSCAYPGMKFTISACEAGSNVNRAVRIPRCRKAVTQSFNLVPSYPCDYTPVLNPGYFFTTFSTKSVVLRIVWKEYGLFSGIRDGSWLEGANSQCSQPPSPSVFGGGRADYGS